MKPPSLWTALSSSNPAAMLANRWAEHLGADFKATERLLLPAGLATTWPCPHCGQPHRVRPGPKGSFVAIPPDESCSPVNIKKTDLALSRLDVTALVGRVHTTLRLQGVAELVSNTETTWRLGFATPEPGVSVPVYFSLPTSTAQFATTVAALIMDSPVPFTLLAPTADHLTRASHTALSRAGHCFFPLSDLITISATDPWTCVVSHAMLAGRGDSLATGTPYSFARAGTAGWRLAFSGCPEIFLPNINGCLYLSFLLHNPYKVFDAIDLEIAVFPEREGTRSRNRASDPSLRSASGRLLANKRELQAEAEEFRKSGDIIAAEERDTQIERIEKAVARLKNQKDDDGERVRNLISKSIASVYRHIAKAGPAAQDIEKHLRSTLDLGFKIQYRPPQGVEWH